MPYRWLLLLSLLFPVTAVFAATGAGAHHPVISAIRFVGNKVTKARILRQQMVVSVGDPADPKRIETSRQGIMDLGLFKSVRADLIPDGPGRVILQITVEEKYYVFPWPLVNAKVNGDYSYGAEMRFDNLAGLNQHLVFSYENKGSTHTSVPKRKVAKLAYAYPRIAGSRYDFAFNASVERQTLVGSSGGLATRDRYDNTWVSADLSRWLKPGPSRGWRVNAGLATGLHTYKHLDGPASGYRDGQSVALLGGVEYYDVHEYPFSRSGIDYGASAEVGVPFAGSDFNYQRLRFYRRRYHRLGTAPYANFNTQFQLGLAEGRQFGADAWSVGGGGSLRGWDGTPAGNALVLANIEYLHPLWRWPQLRGVLFTDIGNTYASFRAINLGDLKWSAGVGLRWKVQSFVNITLAVDAAYNPSTRHTKFYANTSGTF